MRYPTTAVATSASVVQTGRWIHFAAVWEQLPKEVDGMAKTQTLYMDGVEIAQNTMAPGPLGYTTKTLYMGNAPGVAPFHGTMDDIRLYKVARSPRQVRDDATLHASYRFDENDFSGFTADSTGNGFTGALRNTKFVNEGKVGTALSFNGTNGCVEIPRSGINNVQNFALSAWFKPAPNGGATQAILDTRATEKDGGAALVLKYANNKYTAAFLVNYGMGVATTYDVALKNLNPNIWHHALLTRSGVSLTAFVDGNALDNTFAMGSSPIKNDPFSFSLGPRWIGCTAGTTRFFNDLIDQVRIYTRAMTKQSDIQDLLANP